MEVHQCTVFMHDGAPCHRSIKVTDFLRETGATVLEWPGNSQNLNPIENLWCLLKDKLAERQPSSATAMIEEIKKACVMDIKPDYCRSLVESMPPRLAEVIKQNGSHTKY